MAYNKNKVLDLGGADEFENGYTGIIRVACPSARITRSNGPVWTPTMATRFITT